ncbi:adenosine kinase [Psychrobacter sp. I-STPA6b]|uniref:adenosine kinase n=1 Tax=Psychrobacter sp. I-STPA6b TaxID=2585718 RepID=UPI001D0C934C|nr:adenosine kinase [Psychrobacter sp. I-STPA6b]
MYDVMAIGNALVDHEYLISDDMLNLTDLEKGNMTLASFAEQDKLLSQLASTDISSCKQAGGGSAANAMYALASLGGKPFYACRVGDDSQGNFYLHDLHQAGVMTAPQSIQTDGVTGSCVVCVTPDGERTMQTYLGTSSEIDEKNINFDALAQSEWLYLEGYLAMSESIQPAMTKLRQQAGIHNVRVAVSFADPSVVKYAKKGLENMLGHGVAVIFCNLEEAQLFTGKKQHKAAARALTEYCRTAVVTNGAHGVVICQREKDNHVELIELSTPTVADVIDTNGAGDNYAGAFLYGLTQQYSLTESGRLAGEVASKVVRRIGPRLLAGEYQDIARRVLVA